MTNSSFVIGIDFGTTNCTLSYAQLNHSNLEKNSHLDEGAIHLFSIPQITSAGVEEALPLLPSSIYFSLEEEKVEKVAGISWDVSRKTCVGMFAKNRGAELPFRVISSAKSWLCHSEIDRREFGLPFETDEEEMEKLSPLAACATILRHLKEAWDSKMEASFVNQTVLITVPASFDPSARQFVQEAAQEAGYPEIILLEEPQAAFYGWIHMQAASWRKQLKVGDCVLVVDIGGGTTDFSLISVEEEEGNLCLKRFAVGAHLLLGGDNLDLALAYFVRQKFEGQGKFIDDWQFHSLIHSSRHAKEILMSDQPPKQVEVTILGRGSKLIGGTLKVELGFEEVSRFILEGFAPLVSPTERAHYEKRLGFQQVGLPYAKDPRLTCQLAKFLSMTGETQSESMEDFVLPTVVLFNGGTTKSAMLQKRLMDQLNQWAKILGKQPVKSLSDVDYDFAVSKGAVYYGKARLGKGVRIRSGTNASYFIGVEDSAPAVPGFQPPLRAICIAPFGMEEGTELELENQEVGLIVGENAVFRFFKHSTPKLSNGFEPKMGTVVKNWKLELAELHSIETHLDRAEGDGKTIRVKIGSRVTELGVLEIWCKGNNERRWKLEFDIRHLA